MSRVAVSAVFSKATTTIDGGWRISFDVPAHEGPNVVELADLKDIALKLVVIPETELQTEQNG